MINIIYEDNEILVLDKPADLVVNRAESTVKETLQDQLSDYFGLGDGLGIGLRAGIVHRLDRETSGLMVVAKTVSAFEFLQNQFASRKVEKRYVALVHGHVAHETGTIDRKLTRAGNFGRFATVRGLYQEGKEARTDWEVEAYLQLKEECFDVLIHRNELSKARANYLKKNAREYTLLNVYPKTGRTHQIRVHVKSIGNPVVSDLIYAPNKLLKFDLSWCPRLFLHAKSLEFEHPKTHKQIYFESSLSADLLPVLDMLSVS